MTHERIIRAVEEQAIAEGKWPARPTPAASPKPAAPHPAPSSKVIPDPALESWRRVAFKLARHLDQADAMPAAAWAMKRQELLVQLRQLAPKRFDREVPPKRRARQGDRLPLPQ